MASQLFVDGVVVVVVVFVAVDAISKQENFNETNFHLTKLVGPYHNDFLRRSYAREVPSDVGWLLLFQGKYWFLKVSKIYVFNDNTSIKSRTQ